MNASKNSTNLYIGNSFVTPLSQEDWDYLCSIKTPYELGEGRSIIYQEYIPKAIQVKYAKMILSQRDDLTRYEKALSEARHKMWEAERELENINELLDVLQEE